VVPGITVLEVCAGRVPFGYLVAGTRYNPTVCGSPTAPSANVWIVVPYAGRLVGTELVVCAGPVPVGWTVVQRWNDPSQCGMPTAGDENMMRVKRTR
jgi:hypothetical protein